MPGRNRILARTPHDGERWQGKVTGVVVHGAGRGRHLGFPTANVAPDSPSAIPAPAIYSGWMARVRAGSLHPVTVSVGTNPTFSDETDIHVEVYCHDLCVQLYGELVAVWFVQRIRDMVKFSNIEDLVYAARDDVEISARTLTEESRERALAELHAFSLLTP